jgi:hypothetical protein
VAREAPSEGDRFIKIDWGFRSLLVYSRVFLVSRWAMLEKVIGVTALWGWACLVAKPS